VQALEGLKVADFTWAVVGPMMARYLANHGATVARITVKRYFIFIFRHSRSDPERESGLFS